jgi:hypothetical protein
VIQLIERAIDASTEQTSVKIQEASDRLSHRINSSKNMPIINWLSVHRSFTERLNQRIFILQPFVAFILILFNK